MQPRVSDRRRVPSAAVFRKNNSADRAYGKGRGFAVRAPIYAILP